MKHILFIFIVILGLSCTDNERTHKKQVKSYYNGLKNADFNQVKETLADSLVSVEGDYTTAFSRESYHEQFKWDSVFKPNYKIISIEDKGEHTLATITIHSSKFEFLKNNPLTIIHQFSFKSGKISKIVTLDFIGFKYELWEKEKTGLVNWIKINHPEIDGFMNDLTMKGAQNYLKAIDLYTKREIE